MTQSTRSERARRTRQILWTFAATCRQQGRSLYRYLSEALAAHFREQPLPPYSPPGREARLDVKGYDFRDRRPHSEGNGLFEEGPVKHQDK